jgi:hypothetical protein
VFKCNHNRDVSTNLSKFNENSFGGVRFLRCGGADEDRHGASICIFLQPVCEGTKNSIGLVSL